MPELCDVTFLVGPSKIPIHGVKAILGTRSHTMYQLILEKQRAADAESNRKTKSKKSRASFRLIINVRKYQPDDFCQLIQFIHCGSAEITPSNVTGLLCGSKQFGLEDLNDACWDFINACRRSDDNSMNVIERHTPAYCHFKTACRLLAKIETNRRVKLTPRIYQPTTSADISSEQHRANQTESSRSMSKVVTTV